MFAYEMKRIFNNSGVLVIFFLGSLAKLVPLEHSGSGRNCP